MRDTLQVPVTSCVVNMRHLPLNIIDIVVTMKERMKINSDVLL